VTVPRKPLALRKVCWTCWLAQELKMADLKVKVLGSGTRLESPMVGAIGKGPEKTFL
jgi:hypothetical protein